MEQHLLKVLCLSLEGSSLKFKRRVTIWCSGKAYDVVMVQVCGEWTILKAVCVESWRIWLTRQTTMWSEAELGVSSVTCWSSYLLAHVLCGILTILGWHNYWLALTPHRVRFPIMCGVCIFSLCLRGFSQVLQLPLTLQTHAH